MSFLDNLKDDSPQKPPGRATQSIKTLTKLEENFSTMATKSTLPEVPIPNISSPITKNAVKVKLKNINDKKSYQILGFNTYGSNRNSLMQLEVAEKSFGSVLDPENLQKSLDELF